MHVARGCSTAPHPALCGHDTPSFSDAACRRSAVARMTEYDPASDGWTPMDGNPLPAGIGVPWQKREGDAWCYGLLTRADHANPAGAVHGGILAVFADHTLGCYVEAAGDGAPNVTIQLNTHFLAAVTPGSFLQLRGE